MCETRCRLINEVIFLLMIIMLNFAVFKPRVIIFKTVRHFSACILPEIVHIELCRAIRLLQSASNV